MELLLPPQSTELLHKQNNCLLAENIWGKIAESFRTCNLQIFGEELGEAF